MKYALSAAGLVATIGTAVAVAEWGQCGGINHTGSTTCDAGLSCVKINDFYSQCLKTTTTSVSTPTTTSRPVITTTSSVPTTTSSTPPPVSTGYVKVSGQKFTLNGVTFTVVGSNAYWIPQLSNTADMTTAFNDLKKAGFTTLRTWGFNEVTSPSGTYYQIWNGATSTINTGADGLARFDQVVAAAKAAGIRLIVALTNNWSDYGGMDVYVKQILNSNNHDLFYTDATVKAAFKKYIDAFVGRYKNEPTVMAWELANEPRCKGSAGAWTGTCTPATITAWAKEFSAYIKSIAPNQLVALGDEGFFNRPGHPSYPYQGGEGIDFDENLKISTLDFGTAHAYPEHWGESANITLWGVQWIRDHAASQKAANKPVILEEFGVTEQYGRVNIYPTWWKEMVSSGLAGDLIWQAGSTLSYGNAHDDGYTIFPGETEYTLQTQYAAELKARG
ncbi:mannan endo-1,4-beta-mannosidase [Rhizoctonia solani AG-3 Rhs1AP]|uniref:mannan endo-1,4-beta-mannosidase n=2 Tax=Rhizoctonia solani AG-3 TaxID=1086053 RepID=A0A074RIZ0_9AGAM|nr:mannan endo-1,4-beta-mannosidase [Rhizoctonia solani AG-3 Rhs1AP]KEP46729.1 mannan endo-1,4-beta-mannosidase [Rhizoctonia solani 123E]